MSLFVRVYQLKNQFLKLFIVVAKTVTELTPIVSVAIEMIALIVTVEV